MEPLFYLSPSYDGWRNLALDEYFLDNISADQFMLYLYINENAVIIGKNQNPWKECNIKHMQEENVQLVRRFSGGGAVYHDKGNLNFSFIAHKKNYSLDRQMHIIQSAVKKMGIDAVFSGRNDLLTDGKKFSGNAFCTRKNTMLHHGTLLIRTDLTRLSNYLTVSPQKIQSKGITSIKSRVCNLSEYNPKLTVEDAIEKIQQAYLEEVGPYELFSVTPAVEKTVSHLYQIRSSWEWRMGRAPDFDIVFEKWFPWGTIDLNLSLKDGRISKVKVYSDALDETLPEKIESVLLGCQFDAKEMAKAIKKIANHEQLEDYANYIASLSV